MGEAIESVRELEGPRDGGRRAQISMGPGGRLQLVDFRSFNIVQQGQGQTETWASSIVMGWDTCRGTSSAAFPGLLNNNG